MQTIGHLHSGVATLHKCCKAKALVASSAVLRPGTCRLQLLLCQAGKYSWRTSSAVEQPSNTGSDSDVATASYDDARLRSPRSSWRTNWRDEVEPDASSNGNYGYHNGTSVNLHDAPATSQSNGWQTANSSGAGHDDGVHGEGSAWSAYQQGHVDEEETGFDYAYPGSPDELYAPTQYVPQQYDPSQFEQFEQEYSEEQQHIMHQQQHLDSSQQNGASYGYGYGNAYPAEEEQERSSPRARGSSHTGADEDTWRAPRRSYGEESQPGYLTNTGMQQEDEGAQDEADEQPFFNDAFKDALKAALQRSPLFGSSSESDSTPSSASSSSSYRYSVPAPLESYGGEEDIAPSPESVRRPVEAAAATADAVTGGSSLLSGNSAFASALKEALSRQRSLMDDAAAAGSDDEDAGPAAYNDDGPVRAMPYVPPPPVRRELSPMAEVLFTALGSSRLNLRRLNLVRAEIETFIERETKQVERLEFALNKMENDEAYYKGLEKQLERERRQKGSG